MMTKGVVSPPNFNKNQPQQNPGGTNGKHPFNDRQNGKPNIPYQNPFAFPGISPMLPFDSQLIPKFTFDNFIEGQCNQLARSAALAVAQKPGGTSFNPLVLYGPTGIGKTHLVHALGNMVKVLYPNKTVLYVSAEKFTNHFIEAAKNNSVQDFINYHQAVDVLIVEDIYQFANKERTQDIFFHTFNHLHQLNKQIVLTSDVPPRDLKGIEERLLSRFKWGLTADMKVPDFETRIAILESKMAADCIEMPRNVIEYVAHNINTNVRELEGALISLLAHSTLQRRDIDLQLAKTIIRDFINNVSHQISIEEIQKLVSDYFRLPVDTLKAKTRKREVVQARQISMYLAKKFTDLSLKMIGQHFGGRDHTTVIHACQSVLNLMDIDKTFQDDVLELQKQIDFAA